MILESRLTQAEECKKARESLGAKLQVALQEKVVLVERAQGLEAEKAACVGELEGCRRELEAARAARAALEERMQGRVRELEMALGAACKVSKQAEGALAALAAQIERQGQEVFVDIAFLCP